MQIIEPLEMCYQSLCETGDKPVADGSLLDFMRQVSCFGLSLVKLDIRQESERHADVMDAITVHLGMGSYKDWSEEKRQVKTRSFFLMCFEECLLRFSKEQYYPLSSLVLTCGGLM